ncbi:MAG: PspA/IM30 family protein [Pseudomonadota bacterium]
MTETMARRVSRLISGGFNAMVDAVEGASPETVMEEAIREVDRAVDEVRAELGEVIAGTHHASKRLADETNKHTELGKKVELAVAEGRDDLAEAAIAHQMDIEAKIPVLEAAIEDGKANEAELEKYVAALKARRREMEEELVTFRSAKSESPAMSNGAPNGSSVDSKVDKANAAFDRVMTRASGVPGMSTPEDRKSAKDLAELDELARKSAIAERLAKAKGDS